MIPWLLVAELLSVSSKPLSQLVKARIEKYPSSGEINFKVESVSKTIERVKNYAWEDLLEIKEIDGIDMIFKDWRFNLRGSNTEPVIRLNLEASNAELMQEKLTLVNNILL